MNIRRRKVMLRMHLLHQLLEGTGPILGNNDPAQSFPLTHAFPASASHGSWSAESSSSVTNAISSGTSHSDCVPKLPLHAQTIGSDSKQPQKRDTACLPRLSHRLPLSCWPRRRWDVGWYWCRDGVGARFHAVAWYAGTVVEGGGGLVELGEYLRHIVRVFASLP